MLLAERYADDRNAEHKTFDEINHCRKETSKQEPNDVSQKIHVDDQLPQQDWVVGFSDLMDLYADSPTIPRRAGKNSMPV